MEMTTIKTFAVFAIIFGCFAILYPKIFHPMILHILGLNQQNHQNLNDPEIRARMPKHLREALDDDARRTQRRDNLPPQMMRGGPHPGMRAAADMKKQAAASQQGSGGKGMMGIVLPMYAVGIVIYLIYTMTKVFGKKKEDKEGGGDFLNSHFSDVRYNSEKQKFVSGSNRDDGDSEEMMHRKVIQKQKELEKLLLKADKEDINDVEMNELKRRLLETESQMARILQAMEAVQQKVVGTFDTTGKLDESGSAVTDGAHSETAEDSENEGSLDDGSGDEGSDSSVEEVVMKSAPLDFDRNQVNLAEECGDILKEQLNEEDDLDDDQSADLKCIPVNTDLRRRTATSKNEEIKQ